MSDTDQLLSNNQQWSQQCLLDDPQFFERLSALKSPEYFWIGCSDSRVPANEIVGLEPGCVFVHRNVANQVSHTDLNCLSAAQYAVDVLHVKHIIISGHYDCGGVQAAMGSKHHGIVDNWIRSIRDAYVSHADELENLPLEKRQNRLCELNVIRQVENMCHTDIVQKAWERGDALSVHGWIYSLNDGLLHDLHVTKSSLQDIAPLYRIVRDEM